MLVCSSSLCQFASVSLITKMGLNLELTEVRLCSSAPHITFLPETHQTIFRFPFKLDKLSITLNSFPQSLLSSLLQPSISSLSLGVWHCNGNSDENCDRLLSIIENVARHILHLSIDGFYDLQHDLERILEPKRSRHRISRFWSTFTSIKSLVCQVGDCSLLRSPQVTLEKVQFRCYNPSDPSSDALDFGDDGLVTWWQASAKGLIEVVKRAVNLKTVQMDLSIPRLTRWYEFGGLVRDCRRRKIKLEWIGEWAPSTFHFWAFPCLLKW